MDIKLKSSACVLTMLLLAVSGNPISFDRFAAKARLVREIPQAREISEPAPVAMAQVQTPVEGQPRPPPNWSKADQGVGNSGGGAAVSGATVGPDRRPPSWGPASNTAASFQNMGLDPAAALAAGTSGTGATDGGASGGPGSYADMMTNMWQARQKMQMAMYNPQFQQEYMNMMTKFWQGATGANVTNSTQTGTSFPYNPMMMGFGDGLGDGMGKMAMFNPQFQQEYMNMMSKVWGGATGSSGGSTSSQTGTQTATKIGTPFPYNPMMMGFGDGLGDGMGFGGDGMKRAFMAPYHPMCQTNPNSQMCQMAKMGIGMETQLEGPFGELDMEPGEMDIEGPMAYSLLQRLNMQGSGVHADHHEITLNSHVLKVLKERFGVNTTEDIKSKSADPQFQAFMFQVMKRSSELAPGEFNANLTAADVAQILATLDANPAPNQMMATNDLNHATLGTRGSGQNAVLSIDSVPAAQSPNWAMPFLPLVANPFLPLVSNGSANHSNPFNGAAHHHGRAEALVSDVLGSSPVHGHAAGKAGQVGQAQEATERTTQSTNSSHTHTQRAMAGVSGQEGTHEASRGPGDVNGTAALVAGQAALVAGSNTPMPGTDAVVNTKTQQSTNMQPGPQPGSQPASHVAATSPNTNSNSQMQAVNSNNSVPQSSAASPANPPHHHKHHHHSLEWSHAKEKDIGHKAAGSLPQDAMTQHQNTPVASPNQGKSNSPAAAVAGTGASLPVAGTNPEGPVTVDNRSTGLREAGIFPGVNDTVPAVKIQPKYSGSTIFAIVAISLIVLAIIVGPIMCMLYKMKTKQEERRRKIRALKNKEVSENNIMEAMMLHDLGTKGRMMSVANEGATGGGNYYKSEYEDTYQTIDPELEQLNRPGRSVSSGRLP